VQFRFGNFTLDIDRRELRCGAILVAIEPQVFDLLEFLIRQRDRVVTKDDLIEAIWGGRIVSESTLTSRINAARKAVGDSGETQLLIRTVPRKGFRFVGEVDDIGLAISEPQSASTPPTPPPPSQAQDVTFCRTSDGISLAIASVGQGDPLVKAANWLTHVEYDWESPVWSQLLHRLAARHLLIRYDGRGNGLSDRNVEDISFDAFVRDLASVVEAADLKRAAFLGISQGAAVAIAYAVQHPERVSKLVLHGAYAQGRNKRGSPVDAEMARAFIAIMRQGWGDEHSAFMQAFSSVYLPGGSPVQIKWFCDLQRITTSAENAVRIRSACDDIDVVDLLSRVKVPTLVFHSRNDSVVPLEQGRLIAAAIPGARFVTLESDNHMVLPGEPAWLKLVSEIESFLSG
jgi:DNA-binding winged helix-turn-helix (wHTH) protein/pimeloyl-ACP methyl ester carboxylesterase